MAKIFLPNDKGLAMLMDKAWKEFCTEAQKAGYNINDKTAEGFLKDSFIGGYCYGYNDIMAIIRDQIEVGEGVNALNNEEGN